MMDLKNKLKGIPPIYYINLDHRNDRREYMESQFNYCGIKNYYRVSGTKYHYEKVSEWIDIIHDKTIIETSSLTSCHLNHIDTIIKWYDENISETCILMEDDVSFKNINCWSFDWEYFQNNIPENWECVQLYFSRKDYIPMFLHKRIPCSWSTAAYLINRSYAEKIKKYFFVDGKYKLFFKTGSYEQKIKPKTADEILFEVGITYSVPLLGINYEIGGDNLANNFKVNLIDEKTTKVIDEWWKNEYHKFSLEDFFTYGKPNDNLMIKNINLPSDKKITY